jgi:hypothetical protein
MLRSDLKCSNMLRNADIEMFTNAKNFRSVKKVQKPVFNNMSLSLDVKFAPRGELRPPGVNTLFSQEE